MRQLYPHSALQPHSDDLYASAHTLQKYMDMLLRGPNATVNNIRAPAIAHVESGCGAGQTAVMCAHAALR
jgi:hypothetical protein